MTETQIREILIDLNREHLAVMQAVAKGYEYAEIAEEMGIAEITVRTNVAKGLKNLRASLERWKEPCPTASMA